ncbi:unnamed protein product [Polarella glacialis]|uniref:RING-type domain-containing protein n=1 Tax=Polarella glacialis TaxID=89957 RepID=A0A813JWJ8_POLGL|nr:unnamed protein product [Polarella glacialis]
MIAQKLAERRQAEQARQDAVANANSESLSLSSNPLPRSKSEVALGDCAICGKVMEKRRDMKTLPCQHSFHFTCIDDFHRQKLHNDKDAGLPCFTCGVPSNRSIASVIEEKRKAREAQAQAQKEEEEHQRST